MTVRELIIELLQIKDLDQGIIFKENEEMEQFDINCVVEKDYGVWIEGEK